MNTPATGTRKVLFVCTEVFAAGGIQRFNRTLLAALGHLGVACDVYSLNDPIDLPLRTLPGPDLSVRGFGRNKILFALQVANAVRGPEYDCVLVGHVHFAELVMLPAAARLGPSPRILLIAHGTEVWAGVTGSRRRAVRGMQGILCVSDYTKRMVQAQAPELGDDLFCIFPNAVSNIWEEQRPAWQAPVPIRPLPGQYVLSVARLDRPDRTKGIITVIEALPMLDSAVQYLIAGRGNDMDFLRDVARRMGVADRVHLLGSVPDEELVRLYRQASVFALPSGQEGFGIVYLEAMFFGAPVIAAREKGAVDVVQHEQTGLLVDYGDVVGLAKAIDRLLADNRLRERLRINAYATVTGDGAFTFRAFVRRCASVLNVSVLDDLTRTMGMQEQEPMRHTASGC